MTTVNTNYQVTDWSQLFEAKNIEAEYKRIVNTVIGESTYEKYDFIQIDKDKVIKKFNIHDDNDFVLKYAIEQKRNDIIKLVKKYSEKEEEDLEKIIQKYEKV